MKYVVFEISNNYNIKHVSKKGLLKEITRLYKKIYSIADYKYFADYDYNNFINGLNYINGSEGIISVEFPLNNQHLFFRKSLLKKMDKSVLTSFERKNLAIYKDIIFKEKIKQLKKL